MRMIPAEANASSFSHVRPQQKGAPSAPGLHDTLRAGVGPAPLVANSTDPSSASSTPAADSAHPLEARLKAWQATQESLRMETLRRTFGMAEPIRRGMELKIAREGEWRPAVLAASGAGGAGGAGVHEEILRGRETSIDWEDIFTGEGTRNVVGLHDEMERKLRI